MKSNSYIPLSIYIHFPWCIKKCPYCDFNSYSLPKFSDSKEIINNYVNKLLVDIEFSSIENNHRKIYSIYFGGGTPSLMSPKHINLILEKINKYFLLSSSAEITIEANPATVNLINFSNLKQIGITRFSLGVQSFNDISLQNINRQYNVKQVVKTLKILNHLNINFNIDIMFGLPDQTYNMALEDLKTALTYDPNHISWYQFTSDYKILKLPNHDDLYKLYTEGSQFLNNNDFKQYEISAYSKFLYQCKHNINYWTFGDYIGIGSGAHGKITNEYFIVKRHKKISNPKKYMISNEFIEFEKIITREELNLEFMINALRLFQPISYNLFYQRTGNSIYNIYNKLQHAKKLELIVIKNNTINTTNKGKMFLNNLLEIFL